MEKITKRKDGTYCINVYLGTVNHKQIRKSVYGKTQKEVKEKALLLKMNKANGMEILSRNNNSFEFWANAWLRSIKNKAEREGNTDWYVVEETRTKAIVSELGDIPVDKIRMSHIDDLLNEFAVANPYTHKKTSAKTLREYRLICIRIFDYCIANRVLTFNPAKDVDIPKLKTSVERQPITDEEIRYILETPDEMQTACMIMIYAGLRQGELLALTWNDVDFKRSTITVNKSANAKQKEKVKSPKTEAGNRVIPMPEVLHNHLADIKSNSLLVINRDGRYLTHSMFDKSLARYCKIISQKYDTYFKATSHIFRHTYATILFEANTDLLTAKDLLGHSNIQTTLKIYTHLREKQKQKSIDNLNKYLSQM